jgi:uncharacterized protein DUF3616
MTQPIRNVFLRLTQPPDGEADVRDLREGFSAVVQVGRHLWAACDETATLERLTDLGDGTFGEHRTYPLADLLDLPGGEDEEVDVEGLAWSPPYLWVVGSFSRTREKAEGDDPEARIARLAEVSDTDNRYLLARIPLAEDPETGEVAPARSAPPAKGEATAARLRGDGRDNALLDALDGDDHLRRFLKLPGKDNGFDVEGLAAAGERLFLGLRGPVLRGWAVVLEVEVREDDDNGDGALRLRRIGPGKQRYRKHFLDLEGLGVRELCEDGDDLLVLAGPTMEVAAPAAVFRWRGALREDGEALAEGERVVKLLDLPHDVEGGHDHPEGICLFAGEGLPPSLLVVYDAASRHRRDARGVRADVFALLS